ncbi:MAG: alkaline phosphatase family protein [Terriglobales bacterium]
MTKLTPRLVVLLTLFTSAAANAQWATGPAYKAPPHFSHIIFIIQENRTPDTLFGGAPIFSKPGCGGFNGFANGVDLANGGPNAFVSSTNCTTLQLWPNLDCGGGDHSHLDFETEYNSGAMNGACLTGTKAVCGSTTAKCDGATAPLYSPYIAVQQGIVQPYLSFAAHYGWANYMFQTNQGPSFPAHQFLFSGTSAPTWPGDAYYNYFVSENPGFLTSGCDAVSTTGQPAPAPGLDWIDPTGLETSVEDLTPGGFLQDGFECYDRNTLVTVSTSATSEVSTRLDKLKSAITWRYYAQQPGIIWNAPESITQTCYSQNAIVQNADGTAPAACGPNSSTGLDEYNNVSFPTTSGSNATGAPILNDIQNCNLQQISWVTPDEAWSDHPGQTDSTYPNLGPSWVAVILNAIGQSAANSVNPTTGKNCDYWGDNPKDTSSTSVEPTAVFVVWDDWGGFYDHVLPPVNVGTKTKTGFTCKNTQGHPWGCGYTYGFRVPLLVASEYTTAGTVSGALSSNELPTLAQYADIPPEWMHDFGSLLKFTEENFYPAGTKIAPSPYTYADSNTFDTSYGGKKVVPLWEFFTSSTKLPFTAITPGINPETGKPYTANFFETYYQTTDAATGLVHKPTGPDNDGDED